MPGQCLLPELVRKRLVALVVGRGTGIPPDYLPRRLAGHPVRSEVVIQQSVFLLALEPLDPLADRGRAVAAWARLGHQKEAMECGT